MLKGGKVPEEIKDLLENGPKGDGKRKFQTELVNKLFTKTSSGRLVMSTESPTWQNWYKSQDTKFSKATTQGMPKSIILWQTFHGNQSALDAAVAAGDVIENNGFYHYATVKSGRVKSGTTGMNLGGGEVKLKNQDFDDLSNFLDSRPFAKFGENVWKGLMEQQPQIHDGYGSSSRLVSQRQPLALTQHGEPEVKVEVSKVKWPSLEKHIMEAKAAQERLLKDGSRYAAKVREHCGEGGGHMGSMLKEALSICNDNLKEIQECITWQDILSAECNSFVTCI